VTTTLPELIQQHRKSGNGPVVISISGASSSGKTETLKQLRELFTTLGLNVETRPSLSRKHLTTTTSLEQRKSAEFQMLLLNAALEADIAARQTDADVILADRTILDGLLYFEEYSTGSDDDLQTYRQNVYETLSSYTVAVLLDRVVFVDDGGIRKDFDKNFGETFHSRFKQRWSELALDTPLLVMPKIYGLNQLASAVLSAVTDSLFSELTLSTKSLSTSSTSSSHTSKSIVTRMNGGNQCAALKLEAHETTRPYMTMLELQRELQTFLGLQFNPTGAADELANRLIYWRQCISDELAEIDEHFPFNDSAKKTEAVFEVVDILHFVNNLALEIGINPAEIDDAVTSVEYSWNNHYEIAYEVNRRVSQLLNNYPWKSWKKYSESELTAPVASSSVLPIFGSLLSVLTSYAQFFGITPAELTSYYIAKNRENYARQRGKYATPSSSSR
jgi:nicotinamide riboside kinase